MKKLIIFVLVISLFFINCSSDDVGNFQIYLTDQPIDEADQILITLSEINVHKTEEGFFTVFEGEQTYDLLALRNKEKLVLDKTLEEGKYTQIRLVVTSGQIVIAGISYEMIIPSSEVKIPVVFDIIDSGATSVVLDFEAEESIKVEGAGQGEKYILKPVVRVKSINY